MALIKASNKITEIREIGDKFRYIQRFLQDVKDIVNGRISVSQNIAFNPVSVVFSFADTNTRIKHGLTRAPRGYIVISATSSMNIYDGSEASTTSQITLKSSATGTAQIIFL